MEAFQTLRATAAPMMQANIDTDAIISAQAMVGGLVADPGRVLFTRWRYREDGSENPDFVLNQPRYRDARIIVAARNFGCGSSREHAVWALTGYGIRCVIAPSYGEIFYDNAFQNGLLPAIVPDATAERIAQEIEQAKAPELTVDLERQLIALPAGGTIAFEISAERRAALMQGLDDLGLLLSRMPESNEWAACDAVERPWMRVRA